MPENFEQHDANEPLRDALSQALSGTSPDPVVVASRAAVRGRTIRRRRSVLQIGGSVVVASMVVVGSVTAAGAFGHSGGGADPALSVGAGGGAHKSSAPTSGGPSTEQNGAPSATATSAEATTTATPSGDTIIDNLSHPGNNGQWEFNPLPQAAKVVPYSDLLMSLIPSGFTKTNTRLNPVGSQDGRALIDDGKGASLLKVVADSGSGGSSPDMTDCTNNGGTKPDECHHWTTADGTRILTMIIDGAGDAQQQGVKYWDVLVVFKDGTFVSLSERNTDADGDPKTRDVAPLSLDQIATIASDPKWDTLGKTNVRNQ